MNENDNLDQDLEREIAEALDGMTDEDLKDLSTSPDSQNAPDEKEAQRHFDRMRETIIPDTDGGSADEFIRFVGNPIKGTSMRAAESDPTKRKSTAP